MVRKLLLAVLAAGVMLGVGCRHFQKKRCDPCDRRPDGFLDPPAAPRIPPPSLPSTPSDRPETRFRVEPAVPHSIPAKPKGQPELLLPENPPPGLGAELQAEKRSPAKGFLEPPLKPGDPSDLPPSGSALKAMTGLPGYTAVPNYDRVASGRRPTIDGFETLKANGFRTVVYLHAPGANVSAARDLAEKRSLRFVPIEVTPAGLRKALDEFTLIVTDQTARPLYTADEDGVRAGALWYLVFRTTGLLNDDAARLRAASLGLGDATTEEQKQFWLSIQNVLAKR